MRPRVIAAAWGLAVTAALLLTSFAVRDHLPDPMATHWGLGGAPNGSSTFAAHVVTITLTWAVLCAVLLAAGLRGRARRAISWSALFGTGVLLLAANTSTLAANLDASGWRAASLPAWNLPVILAAALLAGYASRGTLGPRTSERHARRTPEDHAQSAWEGHAPPASGGHARLTSEGRTPPASEGHAPLASEGHARLTSEGRTPLASEGHAPRAPEGRTPLAPEGHVPPILEGQAPPRLRLTPGRRTVWVGRATNRWLTLVGLVSLAVIAVVGTLTLLGTLPRSAVGATLPPIALVFLLTLVTTSVTVGAGGDTVRIGLGPLRLPARRIRLSVIDSAWAEERLPGDVGGWGFRGVPGSATIMLRGGECLVLRYRSGGRLAISVDDAERGASLINALIAERVNT
ncbi:hypothetical protein SAMN05444920_105464 [Nonomuraea solani]|uniref:DUF1648 domain-containing protein n=1 Tax=Nonomuraea solani TaxID=1144553 RepID=A0A1H6DIR4_9ACTN|nr:DUF1648 domain-containing protein [Nonomuraea solani]SEG85082.1 hypothetical protein SAMN05444920_105464 [Nonomuraea solani]